MGSTTTPPAKVADGHKPPAIPDPSCPAPAGKHGTKWHRYHNGCRCRAGLRDVKRHDAAYRGGRPISGRVPAIGTARRLQAAAVVGWSTQDVAEQLGITKAAVRRWRVPEGTYVSGDTARKVKDVVEYLLTLPPPQDTAAGLHGDNGPSRTRALAARHGWAPLGAWLPGEIDDPDALSDLAYQRRRTDTPRAGAEYLEKLELGYTVEDIARDYGVDPETVKAVAGRERRRQAKEASRRVSPEQLERVRARLAQGGVMHKDIAAELGISRGHLSNLLAGRMRGARPASLSAPDTGRTTTRPPTAAPPERKTA